MLEHVLSDLEESKDSFYQSYAFCLPQFQKPSFLSTQDSRPGEGDGAAPKKQKRKQNRIKNDKEFRIAVNSIEEKGWKTLMIRNIPNKYTKEQMLATLNRNFRNKFDFFYLPIDSYNDCNVGYAFINFLELKDVARFHKKFHGKKWEKFNSEKIC